MPLICKECLNTGKEKSNTLLEKWATNLTRQFTEREMQKDRHHWKDDQHYSNKRNANWRYHFPPIRLATVQTFGSAFCWGGSGEASAPLGSWWECKIVQSLCRTFWQKLGKLWVYSTCDSGIPLLGIYSGRYTERCEQRVVIAPQSVIAKDWEQGRVHQPGTAAAAQWRAPAAKENKGNLDRLTAAGGSQAKGTMTKARGG